MRILESTWAVKRLLIQGRWREAVLLHHAQRSGMEAGHAMDTYMERDGGLRRINVRMVEKAQRAMNEYERVSRLMYRAGMLSYDGLCQVISLNDKNRQELKANVREDVLEIFRD